MPTVFCSEPARQTPVVHAFDVVVCGGGPAGFAAAYSAARSGASVALIETHGQLGGVWTSGALSYLLDVDNKPGVTQLLMRRLTASQAQIDAHIYDPEMMKLILDQLSLEAGVHVRLHTRIVEAIVDSSRRITHVITESKSGREAWAAGVFIDCTGDGDVAHRAGCSFDLGRQEDGRMQPMSLLMLVTGIDTKLVTGYGLPLSIVKEMAPGGVPFNRILRDAAVQTSYHSPSMFVIRPDLCTLMINHEYGVSGLDAQDLTNATIRARAELYSVVEHLRRLGGAFSNIRIVATGAQIGVREGRRIKGHYEVTTDDLIRGARFEDAICRVTFPVDVHSPDPKKSKGFDHGSAKAQPYDIPMRSLIARDVSGLMMAGRCISGDFHAHSSYRVTGNAVAMGEAVGVSASVSAKLDRRPHELDFQTDIHPGLERLRESVVA